MKGFISSEFVRLISESIDDKRVLPLGQDDEMTRYIILCLQLHPAAYGDAVDHGVCGD